MPQHVNSCCCFLPCWHEGVLRACGLPKDDCAHDATSLPCHICDTIEGFETEFTACSSVCLPVEKSQDGKGVFTARNHDMAPKPMWSWVFGKEGPKRAVGREECLNVIECQSDAGHKSIVVGGHNVLCPFVDGINKKGLCVTDLTNSRGVREALGPIAGHKHNGVTSVQMIVMLTDTSATVREAKKKILSTRILQAALTMHWLIADVEGNATLFNIDKLLQCHLFTDRKPGKPLIAANHAVLHCTDPTKFPKCQSDTEHNTFWRTHCLNNWCGKTKA